MPPEMSGTRLRWGSFKEDVMTKIELKRIARKVLIKENGYAPSYREITLLEASGEGQYMLFQVGNFEYSWDSFTLEKRPGEVSK